MSKVPTLALVRKRRNAETRTFTDPNYPEHPVTLTMAASDVLAASRMEPVSEPLVAEWVEGPEGPKAFPIQSEDGPVHLTRGLIESVVGLWACQAGPEEERYTPEEMLGMALTMDGAYRQALEWAGALNQKGAALGNASRAAPSAGSAAPPSSSDSPILSPASNSEVTSGAPTNGSAVSTGEPGIYSATPASSTAGTTAPERTSTLPA